MRCMCGGCSSCLRDQGRLPVSSCDSCGCDVNEDTVCDGDLCEECADMLAEMRADEASQA
jgi:hypothetical protein